MARRGLTPLHLVQILLPLYDNHGDPLPHREFQRVGADLTERFGGLTAFTRAPAEGMWKDDDSARTTRDEIVVFEVMAEKLDRRWWRAYRGELERRFRQEEIVIRAQQVEKL